MSVSGASEEMAVIWIGERTRPRVLAIAPPRSRTFPGKRVLARRQNQHARRVRSPEFATAREDPPLPLQRKHCANSFSRHNVGAMHPRTLGRPPRRTPIGFNSAFHKMKPPGCERHRRAAREAEGAGANESNAPQRSHHANAFTLIELLVVIAIIAILVGLFFPAFSAVQNQARKAQAKNDLTQIVNAVNAFYTEYGKYPLRSPGRYHDRF